MPAAKPFGSCSIPIVDKRKGDDPNQLLAPRDGLAEAALMEAFRRGWTGVLAEGGPSVFRSLLPIADRIDLFLAGKWFGGGRAWWGGEEGRLGEEWKLSSAEPLGPDLHAVWVREPASGRPGNFPASDAF
jgi:riboflavin biosynthesis pyrimidine reductase